MHCLQSVSAAAPHWVANKNFFSHFSNICNSSKFSISANCKVFTMPPKKNFQLRALKRWQGDEIPPTTSYKLNESCKLVLHVGDITKWHVNGETDAIANSLAWALGLAGNALVGPRYAFGASSTLWVRWQGHTLLIPFMLPHPLSHLPPSCLVPRKQVNAANKRMLGGGGVDGAIHRAAGPELLAACRAVPEVEHDVRCPTGSARITKAFKLPVSHVIYTVGPVYGSDTDPPNALSNAYKNSVMVAKENNIKYVAFPAISCGIYRYPPEAAAQVALSTLQDHTADLKEVHFVLYGPDTWKAWSKESDRLFEKQDNCVEH